MNGFLLAPVEYIGRWSISSVRSLGKAGYLTTGALQALKNVEIWGPRLAPQLVAVGVASVPIALHRDVHRHRVGRSGVLHVNRRRPVVLGGHVGGQVDDPGVGPGTHRFVTGRTGRREHCGRGRDDAGYREGSLGRLLSDSVMVTSAEGLFEELNLLVEDIRANPQKYVRLSIF